MYKKLPADFEEQLTKALRGLRIGDYKTAGDILDGLRDYLPKEDTLVPRRPESHEYFRLRLSTLLAEVAEYRGDYEEGRRALHPYREAIKELKELQREAGDFEFPKTEYLVLRQKLYYLWQWSVWYYRKEHIAKSRELLDLAIDLAQRLKPTSETLLTQLYYGAAKLTLREGNEIKATRMYHDSLMSASQRLDIAKLAHHEDANAPASDDAFLRNEFEAARYSVAKTLALGLAQCLREQGRLEEAHTQAVAGRLLLNLGPDRELSHYAQLLLGSIERSIAGEDRPDILKSATDHITNCAKYFKDHKGEVGYRSRLELALVTMHHGRYGEARAMLEAILSSTKIPKWVADCYLGLSRIARREEHYVEAVVQAEKAVAAAQDHDRVQRRARTGLVLALYKYAAATADRELREERLRLTLKEIDRVMAGNPDVRTKANMLLTKARVHNLRGEIAQAIDVFKQYQPLRPVVEIGRLRQLAAEVEAELKPGMTKFVCPADLDEPNYHLDVNIEALREYIESKVERAFPKKGDRAKAMGRHRSSVPPKPKRT